MKLIHKIHITGTLTVETGMHIGGSEVELEIGGIDNAVIKDAANGAPYIPGSSIKGKLRDLLAKHEDYSKLDFDVNNIFVLFGDGAKDRRRNGGNLIIRDSFFIDTIAKSQNVLEEKSENKLDRLTGEATPRHIERVVKGARFNIDMVMDIKEKFNVRTEVKEIKNNKGETEIKANYAYKEINENSLLDTLKTGFRLLENDYLGGSGTRGYGKVSLNFNKPDKITFNDNGTIKHEEMTYDFNKREQ